MNLTRTLDAASEALSLTEVKNQLRIASSTADHDSFCLYISAVRHRTELFLGKTLITSTWEYKLDEFPDVICLPMGPVQSISTVAYTDTDGNPQTFTDFQNDASGRLMPAVGYSWPNTQSGALDAVTITYIAGQLTAGEVQEDIKHAMLLWIGACDVARENTVVGAGVVVSEIPKGAESILAPHRRQLV